MECTAKGAYCKCKIVKLLMVISSPDCDAVVDIVAIYCCHM